MAGQFDKFVKILGKGSKPDRAVGTWKGTNPDGGPAGQKVEMAVPVGTPQGAYTDPNGGGINTNINQADVNIAQGRREDAAARSVDIQRDVVRGNANKRQRKGLATTTMRLNDQTGEAYDTEETKPAPSGRVMPTRQANPKYLAADVQRQNEDLQTFTEADSKRNRGGDQDPTGEIAFNRGEASKGSKLRSLNGVTYDLDEYRASLPGKPSEAPAPYDISEFEPKSSTTAATPSTEERPSSVVNTKPLNSKMVDKRDDEIEHDENFKAVREYEQKGKGKTTVEYGDTLSKENTSGTTPYDKSGNVKPEYNDPSTIYSTTMHEHNGEVVEGGVRKAPYQKPPVAKTGNVIPQTVIDTYTGIDSEVDDEQAKKDRRNRTPLTSTGPYDPNKTPGRDTFGRTPERRATQAAMREERAADLASQGKSMTTVAPHILSSAKSLAATSRFGFKKDDPFFDTTQFLDHPAVQEATIAHAFGVHHDFSILHNALGGRAPEVARRREAWFKVADRKLRGNPEKTPGEFDILGAAIRKGTTPTTVTRKLERGQKPGITVNGQSPTLAAPAPVADVQSPTRAGTRAMHANTTANVMYQQQQAAKEAHKIMTFTPLKTTTMRLNETTGEAYDSDNKEELLKNTAQSSGATSAGIAPAGSDMVTVRNKNNPDQPAVTRPFTKKERLNKGNVPSADDSKGRF
jgi:hypothetical protein